MNVLLRRQPGQLAILITLLGTLIHLVLAFTTELVADEAYYWTWSLSPRMGYFDHPPLTAWALWLTTHLFGTTRLAVRLLPILSGPVLSYFLYQTAKSISRDRWAGFWAVILLNANILFAAGGFLMTPDTPQVLFYMLTIWSFYRGMENKSGKWILLAGVFFGLGLLSKYTMVLLGPLLLLFLVLSPEHRFWLKKPVLWISLGLSALIFFPDIYWNMQHHWISFLFQWHHGMQAHQDTPLATFLDYLGGQLLMISPGIYLILVWVGATTIPGIIRSRRPELLFLWLTSYPVLLFFAYSSFKAKVEANWPVEGYLSAFILVGIYLAERIDTSMLWRRITTWSLALGFLMVMVVFIQALYPVLPINPQVDGTSRLHGMKTMDTRIHQELDRLPPSERPVAWVVDGYQNAAELKFLEYGKTPVYHIHPRRHFRTTKMTPAEARSLEGKPVLLIQNGPEGGFYKELGTRWGLPGFLKTLKIPRRWDHSDAPIYEVDLFLIPSFRNGFSHK